MSSNMIESAIAGLEKQHGKGVVMQLGKNEVVPIEVFSTGSITLDIALGIGGIPRGRITEIFGTESGGKTTLALHVIANAQREGCNAVLIDTEHAFSPTYAKALGVDIQNLYVAQPDYGEQALDVAEAMVKTSEVGVVVIDSVAAMVPKAELDGEVGDSHMGLQARLMSQAMRRLCGVISKTGTACIFINQIREKIGVVFGNPEVTTGGRALKFYASVRLDIRRTANITAPSGEITGSHVKVKVAKNKLASPFRVAEFDIIYGQGINTLGEIVDLAVSNKLLEKSGTWYNYKDSRIGHGRENACQWLREHPKEVDELRKQILQIVQPSALMVEGAEKDD